MLFIPFRLISSIFTVVSFILPTMSPNSFRDRLMAIISSLALPFSLMSLSYEPLFYMTFTSNIYYWVSMIYTDQKQMYTVCIYTKCHHFSTLNLTKLIPQNVNDLSFSLLVSIKNSSNKLSKLIPNDQLKRWILNGPLFV